jgi:NAD(P)-dependent dehydrogenase (short-subunit alcohol dehydrogenase family)
MSGGAGSPPLHDQWAVVTGGSLGIGLGIAEAFVEAGAHVMIVARRPAALEEAATGLRRLASDGQRVMTATADTSRAASVQDLFRRIDSDLPRLDVYVANAGSGIITDFVEIPLDEWQQTIDLNLTGTFLGSQYAARRMLQSDASNRSILVVSSIRSSGVRPGRLAYSVTKAGLNQFVRAAAYELASSGIRVNGLLPGITATPLALEKNPTVFAEMTATVPLGRAGDPSDMGAAAVYLSSAAASFVTGANLVVDGGESLW